MVGCVDKHSGVAASAYEAQSTHDEDPNSPGGIDFNLIP